MIQVIIFIVAVIFMACILAYGIIDEVKRMKEEAKHRAEYMEYFKKLMKQLEEKEKK